MCLSLSATQVVGELLTYKMVVGKCAEVATGT
jgi:hypothetical protein